MDKPELLLAVLEDVGAAVEDRYDAAVGLVHQAVGGKLACAKMLEALAALSAAASKESDEGDLSPEAAVLVKRHLGRVMVAIGDNRKVFEIAEIRAGGYCDAWKSAVEMLKKKHQGVSAKRDERLAEATDPDNPGHPGPNVKQERQSTKGRSNGKTPRKPRGKGGKNAAHP